MKISEMIRGLSKLNFRTSILFSNKSPIEPDDLLYRCTEIAPALCARAQFVEKVFFRNIL